MFQRRRQLRPHHRLRNFFWPTSGFRRSFSYLWHRIARLPGTPHAIAAGFAFGAAISFTPFIGGHFLKKGWPPGYPWTPGHEWSGVIVAAGEQSAELGVPVESLT